MLNCRISLQNDFDFWNKKKINRIVEIVEEIVFCSEDDPGSLEGTIQLLGGLCLDGEVIPYGPRVIATANWAWRPYLQMQSQAHLISTNVF